VTPLALDTNAYSSLQQGSSKKLYERLQRSEEIYLPFVVVAELRAGFAKGKKTAHNNQKLAKFLDSSLANVLYADENTINLYAQIWAGLNRAGQPVPTNDVWIAALCLQYNCTLATNDTHFQYIPLLQTVTAD